MATAYLTTPFPADVSRDDFGHWFSGFVDGEGCFALSCQKRKVARATPTARFSIGLRADDLAILQLIQGFFACGRLSSRRNLNRPREGSAATFDIATTPDLALRLVPHFVRFPLRAKKARDFAIWREGIEILYQAGQRQTERRNHRTWSHKYTAQEYSRFCELVEALKAQRREGLAESHRLAQSIS